MLYTWRLAQADNLYYKYISYPYILISHSEYFRLIVHHMSWLGHSHRQPTLTARALHSNYQYCQCRLVTINKCWTGGTKRIHTRHIRLYYWLWLSKSNKYMYNTNAEV